MRSAHHSTSATSLQVLYAFSETKHHAGSRYRRRLVRKPDKSPKSVSATGKKQKSNKSFDTPRRPGTELFLLLAICHPNSHKTDIPASGHATSRRFFPRNRK